MKKIRYIFNVLFLLALCSISIGSYAQVDLPLYYSFQVSVNPTAGINYSTAQIDKSRSGIALKEQTTSAKLYLKLDMGDDFVVTDGTFDYKVQYNVSLGNTSFSNSYDLNITEENPEQIIVIDLLNEINGGATDINIAFTIVVTNTSTGSITPNYLLSHARLSSEFVREYGVDVRASSGIMAPAPQLLNPIITGRIVDFAWNTNGTEEFPNYEIQILRLYNTDPNNATNNAGVVAEIDWNKGLRIETQSPETSIKLTMAEGTGFYVWRVRPIGNYYPGGIANHENYGLWNNSSLIQGSSINLDQVNVLSRMDAFYFTDPDEDINWIYNRVFTEGNLSPDKSKTKVSEGMSYADGLLRARQTQAFNSSNNTTLITQTVSDYSGRPAMTTLPVPVSNGLTGYKVGFVKNNNGDLYTARDYDNIDDNGTPNIPGDDIDNIIDPQPVNQVATAFSYYDGTNPNGTANAEGYPFKRTIFKTDGTGRVDEESGVGKTHALGSQSGPGGGKTTRILFGTPSDEELVRIFGDEAPLAESVIKTLTIDPNEVISVTYTSKEGKTIATALISENTVNLLDVDDKDIEPLTVENKANQNVVSNNKMVSSRRIALEIAKNVTLTYNSSPTAMGACAGGDCNLKVRFYINDLTNGDTYISDSDADAIINPFDVNGSLIFPAGWKWVNLDPNSTVIFPSTITNNGTEATINLLPKGEYIITKEVYSTNGSNYVEDEMVSYSEQYTPILNALADKMASIVTPVEYSDFQNIWMPTLKDLIDDYSVNQNTLPTVTTSGDVVDYLAMDVDKNIYIFPTDFIIPAGFMGPNSNDPSQNSLTVTVGCCQNLVVPVPKPEICVVCHGESDEESSNPSLTTILAQVATDISNDFPLTYGIDDIRNDPNAVLDNTNITSEWTTINNIVEHEFMDYLYRKLADEGFIDLYNVSSHPNGYNPDNPTLFNPTHVDNILNLQTFFDKFAPGFTYASMQYMLTNMLASKYYEGQSKEDPNAPGNYYRAKENNDGWLTFVDAAGDINPAFATGGPITTDAPTLSLSVTKINDGDEFNYDCEDLYKCWMQAVELINAFEFDDDLNVMDSFNDENGANSSEDHFDDDDSKEEGNSVINAITSWIISQKMRSFQDEAVVPKERLEALVSFPKIFFRCAGYKYAEILDQFTAIPPDYNVTTPLGGSIWSANIVKDFTQEANSPFINLSSYGIGTPILVERDQSGNFVQAYEQDCGIASTCKSNVLYYEHILKPEWMFKYFVYNSYSGNPPNDPVDDFIPLLNQFEVEINSCYKDIHTSICGSATRCSDEECRYYHKSWSGGQRLNFYQQIAGGRKCSEACKSFYGSSNNALDPLAPCVKEDLTDPNNPLGLVPMANNEIDDVVAVCEYRRAEIKSAIINELLNGCWEIVQCSTMSYHITEAQIEQMVGAVISECISEAEAVRTDLEMWDVPNSVSYGPLATEYPTWQDESCSYIDLSTKTCISSTKRTIVFFPECDQLILDQLSGWDFEPNIPARTDNQPCQGTNTHDWSPLTNPVACTEHTNCTNVQCTQASAQDPINTYSSTKNIPLSP